MASNQQRYSDQPEQFADDVLKRVNEIQSAEPEELRSITTKLLFALERARPLIGSFLPAKYRRVGQWIVNIGIAAILFFGGYSLDGLTEKTGLPPQYVEMLEQIRDSSAQYKASLQETNKRLDSKLDSVNDNFVEVNKKLDEATKPRSFKVQLKSGDKVISEGIIR